MQALLFFNKKCTFDCKISHKIHKNIYSNKDKRRHELLQAQTKVFAHTSKLQEKLKELTSQELALHEEKMDILRQLKSFKHTSLAHLLDLAKEL